MSRLPSALQMTEADGGTRYGLAERRSGFSRSRRFRMGRIALPRSAVFQVSRKSRESESSKRVRGPKARKFGLRCISTAGNTRTRKRSSLAQVVAAKSIYKPALRPVPLTSALSFVVRFFPDLPATWILRFWSLALRQNVARFFRKFGNDQVVGFAKQAG
jgi:hypothetical protein